MAKYTKKQRKHLKSKSGKKNKTGKRLKCNGKKLIIRGGDNKIITNEDYIRLGDDDFGKLLRDIFPNYSVIDIEYKEQNNKKFIQGAKLWSETLNTNTNSIMIEFVDKNEKLLKNINFSDIIKIKLNYNDAMYMR
jgi:hypothetical protein